MASVLLGLLFSSCASDPNWVFEQARQDQPQGSVPVAPSGAPATDPPRQYPPQQPMLAPAAFASNSGRPVPMHPVPSGPPTYTYGVKFEPPDGRILHGMGQWPEGNKNYLDVLNDPALEPAMRIFFMGVGEWPRSWDSRSQALENMISDEIASGHMLHVSIALTGIDPGNNRMELSIDEQIASTSKYDDHIRYVARSIRNAGAPTFVRIGFEFSGKWNDYHPYVYPKAYRKIVDIFREEKVDNAAFVWCWEATCPGDFDEHGKDGWRWYPGDDYVDWFAVDLFNQADLAGTMGRNGRLSGYGNVLKFLDMAEEHHRPVMIAESGAVLVNITPDEEDGKRDWAAWFEPFFKLMATHPSIKAFFYCNSDWKHNRNAQEMGWGDGDISHNDYIAKMYALQMHDPVFMHKQDLPLLRDWKPLPVVEPRTDDRQPPRGRAPPAGG
jgi:hypothetical protein